MGSLIYTKEENNNVISFKSAAKVPLQSAKVYFDPIQAGSGTPSPTNIRSISGRDNFTFKKIGKNLFNLNAPESTPDNTTFSNSNKRIFQPYTYCVGTGWSNYYSPSQINSYSIGNNTLSVNSKSDYAIGFVFSVNAGEQYILSAETTDQAARVTVVFYKQDGSYISYGNISILGVSFVIPDNAVKMIINFHNYSIYANTTVTFTNIQLELGTAATTFQPYQEETINITLPDTFYGGYIDLVSGELVQTMGYLDMGTINWVYRDNNERRQSWSIDNNIINAKAQIDNHTEINALSNRFATVTQSTTWYPNMLSSHNLNRLYITFEPSAYSTTAEVQAAISGAQLVYELATPINYQLTSSQLTALIGQNSLFCQENEIIKIEVAYPIYDTSVIRETKKRIHNYMSSGNILPPAYQKCDYLQTVGTASYIDTGVAGNDNTIKIDFIIEVLSKGTYSGIMGNHDGENKKCWRFIQSAANISNSFNFTLNNRRAGASPRCAISAVSSVVGLPIIVHMEYNLGTLTYQNITYSTSTTEDTNETSNKNIFIGNNGPSIKPSETNPNNRFHSYVKIYKSGYLIRNYVPCYRKSDNKAGFYDTINHTFNPSIGTQEFTAGYNT